jgi:choline dehydrogenase
MNPGFDFIVCGGGTAGCVAARRLADDPSVRVLLLEAGGDERVEAVRNATAWMRNIGSLRDWQFRAEAQPGLDGRRPPLPMGKVLGGGSSINGLIWARGHRDDFEHWARESGDPGWNYASVLALYRRIESWDGPPDARRRGSEGPVSVTRPRNPVPLVAALAEATAAIAGVPAVEDLNGAAMEGPGACGVPNITVKGRDERVSMASAYLRPAMARPNLTVLLHAQVQRLVLRGKRAIGVDYVHEGQPRTAHAQGEVVLCTGAINTPRILMQSGIGDHAHLARHDIPVVQDLPGVGRNFQDHILVAGCVWEYRRPEPPRNNSAEFTFFGKSAPALPTPDLQPVLEECAFGSERTAQQFRLPADPAAAWTLAPGLVRPHSRGRVLLTGKRPGDPVAVHANFLADRRDVDALLRAIELCREIGNSPIVREFAARELMPGPLARADLEAWLRQAAGTYFHQAGTARMGRDALAVVDGALRVHGIERLRVADASVMPTITTGNTMAPCAMIGERAAALLLAAHGATASRARMPPHSGEHGPPAGSGPCGDTPTFESARTSNLPGDPP